MSTTFLVAGRLAEPPVGFCGIVPWCCPEFVAGRAVEGGDEIAIEQHEELAIVFIEGNGIPFDLRAPRFFAGFGIDGNQLIVPNIEIEGVFFEREEISGPLIRLLPFDRAGGSVDGLDPDEIGGGDQPIDRIVFD